MGEIIKSSASGRSGGGGRLNKTLQKKL